MKYIFLVLFSFSLISCVTTQKEQELQGFDVNLSNLNQTSQPQLMKSVIVEWQNIIKTELDKTLKPLKIFIPDIEVGWSEIATLDLEKYLFSFSDVILSDDGNCKIIFVNNDNKTVVINKNYRLRTAGQWRNDIFEIQSYYFMCIFSVGVCTSYREHRKLENYLRLRPDFFYLYDDVLITLENWKRLNKYRNIMLPDDFNSLEIGTTYFIHYQNINIRNSIGNNSYSVEVGRGNQFVISNMPGNQRSGNNFALMFNGYTTVVTQGGFLRVVPEFLFVERIVLPERRSNTQILGRDEMFQFYSNTVNIK